MYDFKTFAQANVDLIFKDFDRLPQPGEEVFARQFTLQLAAAPAFAPWCWKSLVFGYGWAYSWGRVQSAVCTVRCCNNDVFLPMMYSRRRFRIRR